MGATAFKKAKLDSHYDVIIIGSGISGLCAAALLAKAGKKVLVLEKHYTAGGYTHTFTRKDYEWDVGVHYIGEVHRPQSILRRIFDDISEKRLQWEPMGDVYDRAIFQDKTYDFVAGLPQFKETMNGYFPKETKAIQGYIDKVFELNQTTRNFFATKAMPPLLGQLASPLMAKKFLNLANQTAKEVISGLGSSPELMGVLCTQWGDYGLPPAEASFAIQAMISKHYFDGGNYPVGGSASIAESIIPTIEKAGGQVLIRAGVKEIVIHKGKAVGVQMEDNQILRAEAIISSTGIMNTFNKLLPADNSRLEPIRKKIRQHVRHSAGHICLYIGLKQTDAELGLTKPNLWIFPDYDHDENIRKYLKDPTADFPVVYISFPSTKDPDWNKRYPGRSTIEIVSFTPYEWFEKWENTQWYKRGEDYLDYKEALSQRLLSVLYKHVPQVQGNIDCYELSTPLSTKHFSNYERGELYGLDHTPERFRQSWLRPQTPIRNLYLTGQDIVTDGVTGALFGGVLTTISLLKRNVLGEIMSRTR
ncbi:MAG: NAD(P)/FAD-dependent oxidoreductase [SAR324 cluster bacterium]|nr:NAD(P)/FAD-dependent oxidoreductase [SAR324 cluster bacterium]